jgi:thiamine pyrophosphate-dependent acetolactate synthase large subunit-like protein
MIVIGGNGPLDAEQRRPWIDWIHTSSDLGSVVRGYVKWDAAPTTLASTVDAFLTGAAETRTLPKAPVFICVDRALQEEPVLQPFMLPDLGKYRARSPPSPRRHRADAARILRDAVRPVLMVGRVGRTGSGWRRRIEPAETLGAAVVADFKCGTGFPTVHPLHVGALAGLHLSEDAVPIIREADAILALDWPDLGSTLRQPLVPGRPLRNRGGGHRLRAQRTLGGRQGRAASSRCRLAERS